MASGGERLLDRGQVRGKLECIAVRQAFLFVCILFHHSDLKLPLPLEPRLVRFIVTPRMHRIHPSVVEEEVNANWSNGLTVQVMTWTL